MNVGPVEVYTDLVEPCLDRLAALVAVHTGVDDQISTRST